MKMRILVVAVAAAVAGGGALAIAANGSGAPEVAVHQMAADYPTFDTVAAAAAKSAVVVRATAIEVGPAYRYIPEGFPVKDLPAHKAAQAGVVQHDVVYRVDAGYKGVKAGDTVRVVHLGGQIGNDRYVPENEPASVAGQSYVLFLAPVGDGKFGVVGGPQGRYQVDGGRLRALGEADSGAAAALRGQSLTAFEAKPLG
ncbi:hypothetical protein [Saccharothrix syringae]|uniref:SAF domain-containing protein n=1 Tax=Saccharothrix syringae TaxID=103733 RepID=A0A5Q0HAQ1_SACSY|nr:hypothetical protein [Saccharothrix syringae]QFZ23327.1 hypothetical protein EKG83_43090 [Saccharothrix syringae]